MDERAKELIAELMEISRSSPQEEPHEKPTRFPCKRCGGTGWIFYRMEGVDKACRCPECREVRTGIFERSERKRAWVLRKTRNRQDAHLHCNVPGDEARTPLLAVSQRDTANQGGHVQKPRPIRRDDSEGIAVTMALH